MEILVIDDPGYIGDKKLFELVAALSYGGATHREIADALDIDIGAVELMAHLLSCR